MAKINPYLCIKFHQSDIYLISTFRPAYNLISEMLLYPKYLKSNEQYFMLWIRRDSKHTVHISWYSRVKSLEWWEGMMTKETVRNVDRGGVNTINSDRGDLNVIFICFGVICKVIGKIFSKTRPWLLSDTRTKTFTSYQRKYFVEIDNSSVIIIGIQHNNFLDAKIP